MVCGMHKFSVRIYFEDTDAGGVVYYARYASFYERARTEMLREYGFNHPSLASDNVAFVVRKISLDYMNPARVDELLEVQSRITSLSGVSINYEQKIINQQGKLINKAEVFVVCVNLLKMKPMAIPDELAAAIGGGILG